MRNNGQAALEYLMTYGWALVVIVIVIAALFAFGIFTPPTAATCRGLDKLSYRDHAISADGNAITLRIGNGAGSTIQFDSITYGGDFAGGALSSMPSNLAAGAYTAFTNDTAFTTAISGSYSGTVTIVYTTEAGVGVQHTETATCTGTG
jgi:hypothetical protein